MWVHCWHRLQTPTHIHPHASSLFLSYADIQTWPIYCNSLAVSSSFIFHWSVPALTWADINLFRQRGGEPGADGPGVFLLHKTPDSLTQAGNKQLAHWVSSRPLSADIELWAPRPASIWAHSVKRERQNQYCFCCLFCSSKPMWLHSINKMLETVMHFSIIPLDYGWITEQGYQTQGQRGQGIPEPELLLIR